MQEDFLHYVWKFKQFDILNIVTTIGESLNIINSGQHNINSGPDFFNAKLEINDQLWAGNVEVHVKSSDWYMHNHETDHAYDNVILHVVWEHDVEVLRKDETEIPTLVLKDIVNASALKSYQNLFRKSDTWINCENQVSTVDDFVINNWNERLYIERLQQKASLIEERFKFTNGNWEAVLFQLLAKNFGLKVNGDAFLQLAQQIDFSIVRKLQHKPLSLEALLFGQANLLESDIQDVYYLKLKEEYSYLKKKFRLSESQVNFQFFRLRPNNFPTIRLSQFINLYVKFQSVFIEVIQLKQLKDMYAFFEVGANDYWQNHYTFGKNSTKSVKKLTKSFIDLLVINTIVPIQFSYQKYIGKPNTEALLELVQQLKAEKNSIADKFGTLIKVKKTALESQAFLQLKTNYCVKNKCLQCAIGNAVLQQNV